MDPAEDNEFTHVPEEVVASYLAGLRAYHDCREAQRKLEPLFQLLAPFALGMSLGIGLRDDPPPGIIVFFYAATVAATLTLFLVIAFMGYTQRVAVRHGRRLVAALTWPQRRRLRWLAAQAARGDGWDDEGDDDADEEGGDEYGRVA